MKPGDLVEARKIRVCFQGEKTAGSMEFAAGGPPPRHGRIHDTNALVFLFLGERRPNKVLDADAVLKSLGWRPPVRRRAPKKTR